MENVRENMIKSIKKYIKTGKYGYLLNDSDDEYSRVMIVKTNEEIDWEKDGWNMWIVEEDQCSIQVVNNEGGTDYHILHPKEELWMLLYFDVVLAGEKLK
jgi:hypothetical protein